MILSGRERAGYSSKLSSLLDFSSLIGPYIHMKGGHFQISNFFVFLGHPSPRYCKLYFIDCLGFMSKMVLDSLKINF